MTSSIIDFTNTTLFPTFLTIPEQGPDAVSSPAGERWYLLAEVKDNMTITKPTLVLTDRDANPFALVFEGLGRDDLDLKGLGFKKGASVIIINARRTKPADESKRGFVRIEKGDAGNVTAVPAAMERVLELGGKIKGHSCETCGGNGEDGLKRCTGCERAGYCSKECQVKGWNEGGHKKDCRILRALNDIFK
ncbi:Zinc finger MYND domain-containing protein 10 [Cytospora mali]|uniref:Zinc finger MYND domain-containing protein 10 n=1 Tax=Cytospora mali TaxID=578113 RepID=A0A194V3S1_CYTMA|nr:Zinc finger MYND domain-containing protein 10 [Valsa mali var. pyri (nom. inval.)]